MDDPRNLLFVWTDQQAAFTLPAYGNDVVETPNLDALAAAGTMFERPYVTQSVCGPSRSSVMTGRYPHRTGVVNNNVPLPVDLPVLPELGFRDYATGWIGKWHLGDEVFRQRGFDEWVSTEDAYHRFYGEGRPREHSEYHEYLVAEGYEPDRRSPDGFEWFSREFVATTVPEEHSKPAFMAREAVDFVERHRDEPFLLYLMFLEPHDPYRGPRDDQYAVGDVPAPRNLEHDGLDAQPARVRFVRECFTSEAGDPRSTGAVRDVAGRPPTARGWRRLRSNYYGLVSLVDTHVGRVLDAVEDAGVWDRTVTVYTSDHGDLMGAHGLGAKMLQFEEAIRVPLLVRVPDVERESVAAPSSHVDLVPTLLDALDRPIPDALPGRSWLPHLRGDAGPPRDHVVVEWNGSTNVGVWNYSAAADPAVRPYPDDDARRIWARMGDDRGLLEVVTDPVRTIITDDEWKLNYRRGGEHELYRLDEDPHETVNLVDHRPAIVDDLHGSIQDWQHRTRDPVPL